MISRSHYPAVLSVCFGLALALTSVLGTGDAQANDCAQSSYTLNTQSAVDVLGNTGCTAVLGDLTVTGSGITSLATLSNITSIGGDLAVTSSDSLNYLTGLDSLTSVTGAVTINSNGSLGSICNLQNVTTIGGDLVVDSNAGLDNVECFWSLQSVGGNIRFEDNPNIWTLSYLGGLTTHSGSITIHNSMDDLYFGYEAPFALTEIGGDLVIEENGITGVDELINLTSVGGSLTISDNNSLDDVDGLINLSSVGGNLTVQSNVTLGDCLGFVPLLGYPNGPDTVGGSVTFASNQSGCNSVGDAFAGVQPPGQPTITGITAGDGQITLTASVTQQGTFAITGYRGVCTDSQNNSFMSTGTGSSVRVTGLTNGTAYTCTVVALSNGGESQSSGASIPQTPEEKPQIDPAVLWFLIKGSSYVEDDGSTDGGTSSNDGGTSTSSDSDDSGGNTGYCSNGALTNVVCSPSTNFDNWWATNGEVRYTVPSGKILSIPFTARASTVDKAIFYYTTDMAPLNGYSWTSWVSTQPGGSSISELCQWSSTEARGRMYFSQIPNDPYWCILVLGEGFSITILGFTAPLMGITEVTTPSMLAGRLTDTLHSAKFLGWVPLGAFAVSG